MSETTAIVRSRTASLKDVYIAFVTKNDATTYTASAPIKLARAINAKISDKFTTEKVYSDDTVEDVIEYYEGTDVELEVNSLAPQDKKNLFGHLYDKGFLVKNKDDKAPEIALGWRARKLNRKYEFHWLYCGTFGRGYDDNFATQAEKIESQTASLKGSFYERAIDGNYEVEVDESNLLQEHASAKEAISSWFSKVQEVPEK